MRMFSELYIQSWGCALDRIIQSLPKNMPKLNHLLLLSLLVLYSLSQSCTHSQDSSLLLQTGRIQVTNPTANIIAGRLHSYPIAINYAVPSNGFQVTASISNLVLTSLFNNSYDFSVRGGKGTAANIAEIVVFVDEDSTWTNLQLSYLISSRSDLFIGSFIADGYIFQSTANNTITLTFGIPGLAPSNNPVTAVTQFAGIKTFLNQPLSLSFISTTTNSQTGVLTVIISTNSPFQFLYLAYYWWQQVAGDIVFTSFNLNDGSVVAYPFVGLEAITGNKQVYSGTGFNRAGVAACNGDKCPSACIKSTACQALKGLLVGSSCYLCGPYQAYSNGNCVNNYLCAANQVFNGTACVCVQGYLMVNGICYASCGNNAYIPSTGSCQCIPNVPCNQVNNCPNNQILSGTKCVCAVGFASINGNCLPAFSCPPNTIWNAATLSCICIDPTQFLLNGVCANCVANSAWNGTSCVCNFGYHLSNGACVTCPSNYVWNGNSCVCAQGFFLINGVCSQCQANSTWNGSACACNPGFNLINNACATCPVMSVWVDSQKACVCLSGYFMLNNICSTCQANAGWNGSTCVCLSGFVMVNNNCTTCPPNTVYSGTSCICGAGYFNISGVCTPAPINAVFNGVGFVCAPTFGLLNGVCSKCPAKSTVQNNTCVCNKNLRMVNGKCEACPPKSKLNGNVCICNNGLFLIGGNCATCPPSSAYNGSACVCINGFYLNGSECLSCGQNSFWNGASCVCEANFYLINGVCQNCPVNTFWNGANCACAAGLDLVNGVCVPICSGKFQWNGTACVCPSPYYLIQNSCLPCDPNSIYNSATQTCDCKPGFFGNFQLCTACDASCATCSQSGTSSCTSCPSGLTLYSGMCITGCGSGKILMNGNCFPCPPNCLSCSDLNTCTQCSANYSLLQQVLNGVPATTCAIPAQVVATPLSKLALTGTVVGNNVIYQGLTLSTLPAYFLTTNCMDCSDLFTVLMYPNNLGVSYSIQYVLNSQYWFVIVFNYGSSGITPTFDFKVQINFKYANYFTTVDMAQSVTGVIKANIYPSAAVNTTGSTSGIATTTNPTSPTSTIAPTKGTVKNPTTGTVDTRPKAGAFLTTATTTTTTVTTTATRQVIGGGIVSTIAATTISSLFP